MRKGKARKRLVVPIAITVSVVATAATIASTGLTVVASAGCDDDGPKPDAGMPDTPIV